MSSEETTSQYEDHDYIVAPKDDTLELGSPPHTTHSQFGPFARGVEVEDLTKMDIEIQEMELRLLK